MKILGQPMVFRRATLGLLFLLACAPDPKSEIEKAMNDYNHHIKEMDADAIASMFTSDGRLGGIVGQDSIRKFLKSFVDVKVLEQQSVTQAIVVREDSARQEGFYTQQVIVKSDTLNLKGQFTASWKHENGKWYIQKMATKPQQ